MLTQLAFAQITLALAICYLLIGRLSRWRPHWLLLPAAAGVAWLLAAGPWRSVAGYLAGGSHLIGLLAKGGTVPARLGHLTAAFTGWQRWLPRQLPIALVAAAVEAALLELPGRAARSSRYRRGVLVLARCRYLTMVLRRGELATQDGCCLGIIETTGARAEMTWREAEAGVLCLSQDAAAVSATGRDLVLAAIQHRKAVVAIDLNGGSLLLAGQLGPACAQVNAPLRRFSWQADSFDPITDADPAKAASLVLAMIDWTGAGQARRLLCTSYLEAALRVMALARTASPSPRSPSPRSPSPISTARSVPLIDELTGLLAPGALQLRLADLSRQTPARGELAAKVAELAGQLGGDYSVLAPVAGQLAELARDLAPRPADPDSSGEPITIIRALARREVAYFSLDRPVHGRPAEMMARLVIASLTDALAERCDLGIGCDALVWIDGCESVDPRQLAALTSLGARTGTSIVLGTTVASAATALAPEVHVIAVRGSAPPGLKNQLPDDRLPPGDGPDRLSWTAGSGGQQVPPVTSCRVVR
ncbi:MAG TPA: hypothetical protein VN767_28810 [Streptosporangiaceae bacterium]|nr:hypothetical protein [Streptosporangiaceae bacterium]